MTPTQLYGSLLGGSDVPTAVAEAAARFRYGRAEMQIHLALDEPPRWKGSDAERLARCPIVHVTPGLDGVSRAVNEAERGLLPAEATIVCGQPVALDPSRAPDGKSIIWIQLQELPAGRVKGDAAGEIDTGDGTWTRRARARRTPTGSWPGSATRSRTKWPDDAEGVGARRDAARHLDPGCLLECGQRLGQHVVTPVGVAAIAIEGQVSGIDVLEVPSPRPIVVGPGDPEGLNTGTSSLLLRGRYGFHQPWRQAPTATRTKSVPKPRTSSSSRIPASRISFLTARPQIRISSMTT